jgi:hypothetical protein
LSRQNRSGGFSVLCGRGVHLFSQNDVCADCRADVVAEKFALLSAFAVALSEFTIVDFGKFDGVICAGGFVGYAVKSKFDDFDEWFGLTCFVDCLFDTGFCNFNHFFAPVFLLTDKSKSTIGSYSLSTNGREERRKHLFYFTTGRKYVLPMVE